MRFNAAAFARAWLAVAQASAGKDPNAILARTIAIEEYPAGVRLVATDRRVILTAWVPDIEHTWGRSEPHTHEAPDRTVIVHDGDNRGRGILTYLHKLATADNGKRIDDLEVRVTFDVRLPANFTIDDAITFEGMEPTFVVLESVDVEKVYLPVVEASYVDWRSVVLGFVPVETSEIAFDLEKIGRIVKADAWTEGPLIWTFGGPDRLARIEWTEADPRVFGFVMPNRWVLPGEGDTDSTDDEEDTSDEFTPADVGDEELPADILRDGIGLLGSSLREGETITTRTDTE